MFQSVGLKARYIECLPNPLVSSYTETEDTSQFKNLDGRMRGLWGEVLSEVKKYGYDLDTPGQLLKFVEDESTMVKLLDLALEDDSMLMTAIPILCSGESHLHKLNVHWLFNWFMENAQQMRIKNLTLYRQIWLPQIFAMIAQTSGQFRQHYFRALSLLQREVL